MNDDLERQIFLSGKHGKIMVDTETIPIKKDTVHRKAHWDGEKCYVVVDKMRYEITGYRKAYKDIYIFTHEFSVN